MVIATIITPPSIAPADAVFYIMSEPCFSEGPEYEKIHVSFMYTCVLVCLSLDAIV